MRETTRLCGRRRRLEYWSFQRLIVFFPLTNWGRLLFILYFFTSFERKDLAFRLTVLCTYHYLACWSKNLLFGWINLQRLATNFLISIWLKRLGSMVSKLGTQGSSLKWKYNVTSSRCSLVSVLKTEFRPLVQFFRIWRSRRVNKYLRLKSWVLVFRPTCSNSRI